jgi:hypothetical protein
LPLCFFWLLQAYHAAIAWKLSFHFFFWTVLLLLSLLGVGGRGAWRMSQQWLLVPGGLVVRTSSFRRRGWKVHLFVRSRSALVAYRQMKLRWTICVADPEANQMTMITPTECHALLRAWLSPLEPPDPDRLSDLT